MYTIEQQATLWLIKEKDGLSKIEQNELNSWLNDNTDHQNAYDFNKMLQTSFQTLPSDMLEELSTKTNKGASRTKIIEVIKPLAFAAMILLTLSIGMFRYLDDSKPVYMDDYITKNQINKKIFLPDDSTIVMDVKSKINIVFYKNTREVEFLKGKAIFSIAKDEKRPFIINSQNTRIKVVGTKFEVTNIENTTSIKVKEGTVKVSQTYNSYKEKRNFILKEGNQLSLDQNGKILTYGKIDIDKIATWEKGFFLFSDMPLLEAIGNFSRYTDLKVQYENSLVSHTLITGKFSISEFSNFIEALPKIYPLKIERNKGILKISQN